jgi:hypothetical protein
MYDIEVNDCRARMFEAIADFFVALTALTKIAHTALVAELAAKQQQGERRRPTTRYPEDGPRT